MFISSSTLVAARIAPFAALSTFIVFSSSDSPATTAAAVLEAAPAAAVSRYNLF
jgi:hypothetical protein